MIIKTRKDVCYPDGGRIVAGVTLRVNPVDGGYKVTTYEHTGRVVPSDAAVPMDQERPWINEDKPLGRKKQYG